MPRKGAKLSPEAQQKQREAISRWKMEHMASVTVTVRRERAELYKALAAKRGTTLRAMIVGYLDGELQAEGME